MDNQKVLWERKLRQRRRLKAFNEIIRSLEELSNDESFLEEFYNEFGEYLSADLKELFDYNSLIELKSKFVSLRALAFNGHVDYEKMYDEVFEETTQQE